MKNQMKKSFSNIHNVSLIFLTIIIVCLLIDCSNKGDEGKTNSANAVEVTITAYDLASDSYLNHINVWDDYDGRNKIITKLYHRDKVKMLKRVGDGVIIETPDGKVGWLSYFFIKEIVLKEGMPVWNDQSGSFTNQIPDPTKL